MYTRKNRHGGGIFNFLSGSKNSNVNAQASALKAKRNYNLKHSKSRVVNVLGTPGTVKYTNKERIESEYQQAIEKLKTIEQPKETASALQTIASKLGQGLQSQEAKQTGAVVITIPVGMAQLAYKAIMIFLAALAFVFIDIPSFGQIPVSAYLLPNRNFNTTRNVYNRAQKFTGANTST